MERKSIMVRRGDESATCSGESGGGGGDAGGGSGGNIVCSDLITRYTF